MRSWCVTLVAVLACRGDEPIGPNDQLDRPNDPARGLAWAPPEQPPPPPPPPPPGPVPPPVEITSFLAKAAHTTEPWRVTINELADRPGGQRFLGYRLTRVRVLPQPLGDELVARLALATSFIDGDVGCVGNPIGIRVARGSVALEFVEDCSHVYLTKEGHDGRGALFSSEMSTFIKRLHEH